MSPKIFWCCTASNTMLLRFELSKGFVFNEMLIAPDLSKGLRNMQLYFCSSFACFLQKKRSTPCITSPRTCDLFSLRLLEGTSQLGLVDGSAVTAGHDSDVTTAELKVGDLW